MAKRQINSLTARAQADRSESLACPISTFAGSAVACELSELDLVNVTCCLDRAIARINLVDSTSCGSALARGVGVALRRLRPAIRPVPNTGQNAIG